MHYSLLNIYPLWAGSLICPSEMHCTQVLGQQVAVAVGLEGDPLGKKVLGLLVLVSVASASGISGVIGILEGITTSFSFLSDEVTVGSSAVGPLILSCTAAKKLVS